MNLGIEMVQLVMDRKKDELQRRELSQGTYHDVAKMNRLRQEITELECVKCRLSQKTR